MSVASTKAPDQINVQISGDPQFNDLLYDITEKYSLEFSISESKLPRNKRLYVRIRYITFPNKVSGWSETTSIPPIVGTPGKVLTSRMEN